MFKCPANTCDKSYQRKRDLDKHYLEKHINPTPFKCKKILQDESICTASFDTKEKLDEHKKNGHNYICNYQLEDGKVCNSSFKTNSNLLRHHKDVHLKIKDFICNIILENGDVCNQKFDSKTHLDRHINSSIHLDMKNFICNFVLENKEVCNKAFHTNEHLNEHLKRHNGDKNYICDYSECKGEIKFVTIGELNSHIEFKHTKKSYNFICDFILENGNACDKKYKCEESLDIHKFIHTGEKPYNCNLCSYITYSKSNLNRHIKHHLQIKEHICNYTLCGSSFVSSDTLKRHFDSMHSEEAIRNRKKSETRTYNMLLPYLKDIKREQYVSFACTNSNSESTTCAKIDFIYIQNGIIYAIENDEYQHKRCEISCEVRRMIDVKTIWLETDNDMPLVWIRYNPDTFRINGDIQNISNEDRIKNIINFIEKTSKNKDNISDLSIIYFYYNLNKDKQLCIFDDPDYPDEIKSLVQVLF